MDAATTTVELRSEAAISVYLDGRGGAVMPSFLYGSTPRFSVTFTTNDAAADPTEVTFRIYNEPDGFSAVKLYSLAEITKASAGNYYIDYQLSRGGSWTYRFEGTGALVAVAEGSVWVNDSAFYP